MNHELILLTAFFVSTLVNAIVTILDFRDRERLKAELAESNRHHRRLRIELTGTSRQRTAPPSKPTR